MWIFQTSDDIFMTCTAEDIKQFYFFFHSIFSLLNLLLSRGIANWKSNLEIFLFHPFLHMHPSRVLISRIDKQIHNISLQWFYHKITLWVCVVYTCNISFLGKVYFRGFGCGRGGVGSIIYYRYHLSLYWNVLFYEWFFTYRIIKYLVCFLIFIKI